MVRNEMCDLANELYPSYYNCGDFTVNLSYLTPLDTDTQIYTERKPVSYIDKDGQTRTMIADVKYYSPMHDPVFTVAVECDELNNECYCESLL